MQQAAGGGGGGGVVAKTGEGPFTWWKRRLSAAVSARKLTSANRMVPSATRHSSSGDQE